MFTLVCKATQKQVLRKSRLVRFDPDPNRPKFELVGDEVLVHDSS